MSQLNFASIHDFEVLKFIQNFQDHYLKSLMKKFKGLSSKFQKVLFLSIYHTVKVLTLVEKFEML